MNKEHERTLKYSLNFPEKEKQMIQDLSKWLPDSIIDTHTHITPSSCVGQIPLEIQSQGSITFTSLSVEESEKIKSSLYPKTREIISLCMAMPIKGIDHRSANIYLSESLRPKDHPIFYGIPDDIDYTANGIKDKKFKALKMYPFYFAHPDGSIYQYFKPEILKEAANLEFPIILHLPTKVTACLDQLTDLLTRFPKLPVVLAHMGRERIFSEEVDKAYSILKAYPNLFLETSTAPSVDIFKSSFRHFGEDRVVFGSDEPFNLIRATVVELESGEQRYLTKYKYIWADMEEQKRLSLKFADKIPEISLMHFQNLYALWSAIDQNYSSDQDRERAKEKIFSTNAAKIFKITPSILK